MAVIDHDSGVKTEASNGMRERVLLAGGAAAILALVAALWFIFSTVDPLALAIIAVLVFVAVGVTYRMTRSATRNHDAEVVQAGVAGMQHAMQMVERYMEINAQLQAGRPATRITPPLLPERLVQTSNNQMRLMNAADEADEPDNVTLQLQAGGETEIPLEVLTAFFRRYPKPTQDTVRGMSSTDYGRWAELLCAVDPPLLRREGNGYRFAVSHYGAAEAWWRKCVNGEED